MGHRTGARAPFDSQMFNFSGHFRATQTLTLDSMWLLTQNKYTGGLASSFVTVYCKNFIIFFCVTLKLFSLGFMSLVTPNPGDASVHK